MQALTLLPLLVSPSPAHISAQMIDELYPRIKPLAVADAAQWGGADITRGYTQLTTEWIPIRTKQLLQTYAPGGTRPLLPGSQDNKAVQLSVGRRDPQFVEVRVEGLGVRDREGYGLGLDRVVGAGERARG